MVGDELDDLARTRAILEKLSGEDEIAQELARLREEVSELRHLYGNQLEQIRTAIATIRSNESDVQLREVSADLRREISEIRRLVQETLESGWARQHIANVAKDAANDTQRQVSELTSMVRQSIESGWARQHTSNLIAESVREIRQLVGPVGIPFPDDTILTRTIHGHLYYVDARDTIITPQMLIYRQWEPDLTELFLELVEPDGVFVDVGANIGYFSCLVAARMGQRGGRVFAFEPNPRLTPIIRKNITVNWTSAPILLSEAAVSNRSGNTTLYIPSDRGANASMSSGSAGGADVEIIVPTTTLDEALPDDVKVDLLKIDIEGYELYALQGARSVIDRSKKIRVIMEWSIEQMTAADIDPRDVAIYFDEMGLKPFKVSQRDFEFPASDALNWADILQTSYANLLLARCKESPLE
ncbi:FkbM family methyltransferase [Ensifer adhaerens]|uniref:FkbM family methyltransferase n=1 Tax=Ensifer adhaerens TaxID=106592 RepID=UPI003D070DE8